MKFCTKCQETKALDFFNKNKAHKDGLQNYCKLCGRIANRVAYARNADLVCKKTNAYKKINAEKVKITNRKHFENNRELYRNRDMNRIARKQQAIPLWFEQEKVALVYKKAKEWGFEVDHIVPLKGKNVCGLHCWANLQLLDSSLNCSKGNRKYPTD
jgi:hypothetical protein